MRIAGERFLWLWILVSGILLPLLECRKASHGHGALVPGSSHLQVSSLSDGPSPGDTLHSVLDFKRRQNAQTSMHLAQMNRTDSLVQAVSESLTSLGALTGKHYHATSSGEAGTDPGNENGNQEESDRSDLDDDDEDIDPEDRSEDDADSSSAASLSPAQLKSIGKKLLADIASTEFALYELHNKTDALNSAVITEFNSTLSDAYDDTEGFFASFDNATGILYSSTKDLLDELYSNYSANLNIYTSLADQANNASTGRLLRLEQAEWTRIRTLLQTVFSQFQSLHSSLSTVQVNSPVAQDMSAVAVKQASIGMDLLKTKVASSLANITAEFQNLTMGMANSAVPAVQQIVADLNSSVARSVSDSVDSWNYTTQNSLSKMQSDIDSLGAEFQKVEDRFGQRMNQSVASIGSVLASKNDSVSLMLDGLIDQVQNVTSVISALNGTVDVWANQQVVNGLRKFNYTVYSSVQDLADQQAVLNATYVREGIASAREVKALVTAFNQTVLAQVLGQFNQSAMARISDSLVTLGSILDANAVLLNDSSMSIRDALAEAEAYISSETESMNSGISASNASLTVRLQDLQAKIAQEVKDVQNQTAVGLAHVQAVSGDAHAYLEAALTDAKAYLQGLRSELKSVSSETYDSETEALQGLVGILGDQDDTNTDLDTHFDSLSVKIEDMTRAANYGQIFNPSRAAATALSDTVAQALAQFNTTFSSMVANSAQNFSNTAEAQIGSVYSNGATTLRHLTADRIAGVSPLQDLQDSLNSVVDQVTAAEAQVSSLTQNISLLNSETESMVVSLLAGIDADRSEAVQHAVDSVANQVSQAESKFMDALVHMQIDANAQGSLVTDTVSKMVASFTAQIQALNATVSSLTQSYQSAQDFDASSMASLSSKLADSITQVSSMKSQISSALGSAQSAMTEAYANATAGVQAYNAASADSLSYLRKASLVSVRDKYSSAISWLKRVGDTLRSVKSSWVDAYGAAKASENTAVVSLMENMASRTFSRLEQLDLKALKSLETRDGNDSKSGDDLRDSSHETRASSPSLFKPLMKKMAALSKQVQATQPVNSTSAMADVKTSLVSDLKLANRIVSRAISDASKSLSDSDTSSSISELHDRVLSSVSSATEAIHDSMQSAHEKASEVLRFLLHGDPSHQDVKKLIQANSKFAEALSSKVSQATESVQKAFNSNVQPVLHSLEKFTDDLLLNTSASLRQTANSVTAEIDHGLSDAYKSAFAGAKEASDNAVKTRVLAAEKYASLTNLIEKLTANIQDVYESESARESTWNSRIQALRANNRVSER